VNRLPSTRCRSYSFSSSSSAAAVVTVPASPCSTGCGSTGMCARNTASACAWISAIIAGVGGSAVTNRSVSRTAPIGCDTAASTSSPSPTTSSVDAPPMSITRSGPPAGVSRATLR
jgi:hypothetical protein